jgi:chemotaxis protein CheC
MNGQTAIWNSLIAGPQAEELLGTVMQRVALALSDMVGLGFSCDTPWVQKVPIAQVATRLGDPETETIGVYLLIKGSLHGQAILMLPLASALSLIDLLMGASPGAPVIVRDLDPMERSALAEIGNLMVSYFLNAVASLGRTELRPSPPAVAVDMMGAILDRVVVPAGNVGDALLIIETTFRDAEETVQIRFWVLPDPTDSGV